MSEKESVSNNYIIKAVPVQEVNLNGSLLDEYVEVEEEYCGPVTTCFGIMFFIFYNVNRNFFPGRVVAVSQIIK